MDTRDYLQDIIPELEKKLLLEIEALLNIEYIEDNGLLFEFDLKLNENQIEEQVEKICFILQDSFLFEIDYQEFVSESTVKIQLDSE
jgi:hypothetical protein